ncbi:hypothetical protein B6U70_03235 [Euryarchaeota archaeon ex4484_162]|nr:MAG: hypothetical protein B6U70_03235 [Euryarchaeota archaeon ex4484_162]
MEFWNDIIIQRSWELLKDLNKKFDFIVIGGWGIYLWTHAMKSKDIDILLSSWHDLEIIKKQFEARKNDRLRKYEIVILDVDVDIYVPHYSRMVIPCNDLLDMAVSREGFKVLEPEPLLILKQQAFLDRRDSIKGQKDRVDMLSLLLSNVVDFKKYKNLLHRYKIGYFKDELRKIINSAKEEFLYLNIKNPREVRNLKRKWLTSLER